MDTSRPSNQMSKHKINLNLMYHFIIIQYNKNNATELFLNAHNNRPKLRNLQTKTNGPINSPQEDFITDYRAM